ncbi:hypothetical protein HHK36_025536 [Tetracentron sinense]|uniref:PWWP domain-containing protein n=1 Tax=Tetracentron sinense TaxID=13715 RepID=A0A834YKM5_TETSI|nr:hypothetical protein HHK36_025536 [Tetracentron sinense]
MPIGTSDPAKPLMFVLLSSSPSPSVHSKKQPKSVLVLWGKDMGSSCELNMKGIDASAGGLVWVRRRNGSWWPGQIMGLDDLPESCLVSPRSGTPVKLLGREDASVDWYNLEKSKRVKAFHCGEYDDCIEKAKASADNSSKKAVKYARREDAILHALEIENACISKERHDILSKNDYSDSEEHDNWARQPQKMFNPGKENENMAGSVSTFEGNSTQDLAQSGISFEEPNDFSHPKVQYVQKKRQKNPNDSEDDGTEGIKRMRGIEDLGMRVVSRRKSNMYFHSDGPLELVQLDSSSLSASTVGSASMGNSLSTGSPVNSSKGYCSSLKRRLSQVANFHETAKRKDRRRPLTKVLQSTAMVSVPVFCDQDARPGGSFFQRVTDGKVSAFESKKTSFSVVTSNNSDSTGASYENQTLFIASELPCDAGVDAAYFHSKLKDKEFSSMSAFPIDDCSETLFDVPLVEEEKQTGGFSPIFLSCSSGKLQAGAVGRQSSHCSQFGSLSLRNEGLDESGSTSFAGSDINDVSPNVEKGNSKWLLKGKRNSRNSFKIKNQDSRIFMDRDDESDAYVAGIEHLDELSVGCGQKVDVNNFDFSLTSDNCGQLAKPKLLIENEGDGPRHWSNHISYRATKVGEVSTLVRKKDPLLMRHMPDSSPTPQKSLPYRQSRFTTYSSCQIFDAPIRNMNAGSSLFDVNLEVRASYKGQHVPLVSLMSKLNGKAIIGHPLTIEVLDDGYCELLLSSIDGYPISSHELYDIPRENLSDQSMDITNSSLLLDRGDNAVVTSQATGNAVLEARRNPIKHLTVKPYLSPKKSPAIRRCGLFSRKTRKLSSLTVAQGKREEKRKLVAEKLGGLVIACVPLKVVFSRINEAVNSLTQSAHCIGKSRDL